MNSRLAQGFLIVGLTLVSLLGAASANANKPGYTPPAAATCSDLQGFWDSLYNSISFKLEMGYPTNPGLVAALEHSMLGARPICPDSTLGVDLNGLAGNGLIDLSNYDLTNLLNNDPPTGGWTNDPLANGSSGNDPTNSWTGDPPGAWSNDWNGGMNGSVILASTGDAPTSVPEPTSLVLLGTALGLLGLRRRRDFLTDRSGVARHIAYRN